MKLEYWVTTQFFLQLSQAKRKEKKVKSKFGISKERKKSKTMSQKRHLKKPCQKKSKFCVDLSKFEYYKINGIFT
jgi:hypothetical protein